MTTITNDIPAATKRPRRSNESSITRSQAVRIMELWNGDDDLSYKQIGAKLDIKPHTVGKVVRGELTNFAPEESVVAD